MSVWRIAIVLSMALIVAAGSEGRAYVIAPRITGAQVTAVGANTPARRAKLEVGDVIVAIDGQPIRVFQDFPTLLTGKRRTVLLVRDGRTGQYVTTVAAPINGRLGILFQVVTVPERTLPQMAKPPQPGR